MYLVLYTLIGDGSRVREVHTVAVEAETTHAAVERVNKWFGEGYLRIVKVECVANPS